MIQGYKSTAVERPQQNARCDLELSQVIRATFDGRRELMIAAQRSRLQSKFRRGRETGRGEPRTATREKTARHQRAAAPRRRGGHGRPPEPPAAGTDARGGERRAQGATARGRAPRAARGGRREDDASREDDTGRPTRDAEPRNAGGGWAPVVGGPDAATPRASWTNRESDHDGSATFFGGEGRRVQERSAGPSPRARCLCPTVVSVDTSGPRGAKMLPQQHLGRRAGHTYVPVAECRQDELKSAKWASCGLACTPMNTSEQSSVHAKFLSLVRVFRRRDGS